MQAWGSDSMYISLETVDLSELLIRLWCLALQVASQLCHLFVSLYSELSQLKNKHSLKHKSSCN